MALGAQVVIAARRLDVLEEAAKQLNAVGQGGKAYVCTCNVRNEEEIKELVAFALAKMGRIDGLVNNAGGQFVSPVENISARGFKAVVETNLHSCFLLSKEVYNQWWSTREEGEGGGGSIVNIILANKNGFPMMAHRFVVRVCWVFGGGGGGGGGGHHTSVTTSHVPKLHTAVARPGQAWKISPRAWPSSGLARACASIAWRRGSFTQRAALPTTAKWPAPSWARSSPPSPPTAAARPRKSAVRLFLCRGSIHSVA